MLTRDDIVRISEGVIRELKLVEDYTNPQSNIKTIHLTYRGQIINSVSINVESQLLENK